jgi:hypothetical protein
MIQMKIAHQQCSMLMSADTRLLVAVELVQPSSLVFDLPYLTCLSFLCHFFVIWCQRLQPQQLPSPGADPTAAAAAAAAGDSGWSERMQQQYGLDTSQFSYRPGAADAEGLQQHQDGGRSRGCVMM